MIRLMIALVTLALLFSAGLAMAHDAVRAEIDVELVSPNEARIATRGDVRIAAPPGCSFERPVLRCEEPLAGRAIETIGADAFVRVGDETTLVTTRTRSFTVPGSPGPRTVLGRFFRLGVEHILSGVDHVLFLAALFWTAGGRKRALLAIATAFTVAHSVTLAATMVGALHVPPAVAEACIALSLVLVALDLGRAGTRPQPLMAGAFGLVHGLGFAGAMAETRLPEGGRWSALLAFNLGIELGQLAVFAACLALVRLVRFRHAETATAYVVGVVGMALLFLRTPWIFR